MREGQRTVLAQQAMDASDVIHMTFKKRVVGKNPPRKLVVQVPDGPSTDGGKRARQSITLAPEHGEGPALMCGWLDIARHEAELRSFEVVSAQHEKRFGHGLDVTVQEYRDLLQDLQRTLANLQVQTQFVDTTAGLARPKLSSRGLEVDRKSPKLTYALVGVAVLVAALLFLLR